jgi:hypothetical protein
VVLVAIIVMSGMAFGATGLPERRPFARDAGTLAIPEVRIRFSPAAPGPARSAGPLVGVTHTQVSADAWRNRAAVERAGRVLRETSHFQNQSIMGWGALNPEPSRGRYDWTTLDRRIALIERTGGTPVVTLCCAPDWMKGGRPGSTDWSRLTTAPLPSHVGDFADLAAAVARRYPQVRYFQVWNELKGFYDRAARRWDAAGYTELYNRVYDAIKRVRPTARVGGPYVVIDSEPDGAGSHPSALAGPWGVVDQRGLDVLAYWLEHAHGADFVSVDARTTSHEGRLTTDEFTATGKFAAITGWLAARTRLPIWWSEWYVRPGSAHWSARHDDAVMMSALTKMAASGASTALIWQPEGRVGSCRGCLWSDTAMPDGGDPTLFAQSLAAFVARFPPGSELVRTAVSSNVVELLATARTALVINTRRSPVDVVVDGQSVRLHGYEVRYLTRRPGPG